MFCLIWADQDFDKYNNPKVKQHIWHSLETHTFLFDEPAWLQEVFQSHPGCYISEATCSIKMHQVFCTWSVGKRCSLSSSAAMGASSFSAKSWHVWRSIWWVSGNSTVWYIVCSCRIHWKIRGAKGNPGGIRHQILFWSFICGFCFCKFLLNYRKNFLIWTFQFLPSRGQD